jgi:hypothetical protein
MSIDLGWRVGLVSQGVGAISLRILHFHCSSLHLVEMSTANEVSSRFENVCWWARSQEALRASPGASSSHFVPARLEH